MEIKVLNQQSVFDVAIQHSGSPEAAFLLAASNDLSITDELEVGSELDKTEVTNKNVAGYYANRKLLPATGFSLDDGFEEGIEFWYVEYDLVSS
jgi:hypothetical protein